MTENHTTDGTMANSGTVAENALEQPQREWATPQFERIPLTEAMGTGPNSSVTDGLSLYS